MSDKRLQELAEEKWLRALAVEQYRKDMSGAEALLTSDEFAEPDAHKIEEGLTLLQKALAEEDNRVQIDRQRRRLRIVFLVAVVLAGMFAITVFAERFGFFAFITEKYEEYSYMWSVQTEPWPKPEGWSSDYYPTWLPEGFELQGVSTTDFSETLQYEDENENQILFVITKGAHAFVNTEDMEESSISISGYSCKLYARADHSESTLVIPINGHTLCIAGDVNPNEITLIAQKINLF